VHGEADVFAVAGAVWDEGCYQERVETSFQSKLDYLASIFYNRNIP
jgi:hypothetical protein